MAKDLLQKWENKNTTFFLNQENTDVILGPFFVSGKENARGMLVFS